MPPERGAVVNVLTVDVEEYYHGVDSLAAPGRAGARLLPSRVAAQTERLLDLLDAHRARATFFTLGVVAERLPRLVRAIAERGHEVASHGWDDTLVSAQRPEEFRRDVRTAKRQVEQATGHAVWGYRAPHYSIRRETPWALPILAEEGYTYDSSVHPVARDRYAVPDPPRFTHVAYDGESGDFWEVPVGTARWSGVNLPIGGGFFRLFPRSLVRGAIASVNRRERRPAVLYVHPWEFDPGQPRLPMPTLHRFRHYVGLERAEAKLAALLDEFAFTSIAAAFPHVRPHAGTAATSAAS